MRTIADVLLVIGCLAAVVFTADYVVVRPFRRYVPWWRSGIGVMFALLGLSITFLGGFIALALTLGPDFVGREIVRLVCYGLFCAAMVWLVVVYFFERATARDIVFTTKKARAKK